MVDTESELTSRIEAALHRIARLSDSFSDPKESIQASSELRSALASEREKSSLLESELNAARNQLESVETRSAREIDVLGANLQRSKDELATAAQANSQLSQRCSELEASLEQARLRPPSGDARNAEIEQLLQERAADLAEIEAILRELKPLVEDVRNA